MAEHETVTQADVDGKITTHKGDASAHHAKTDIFDKFREFIPWVSLDGFTVGGDAGYSVLPEGATVELKTADGTADFDAFLYAPYAWNKLLDAGKIITVEFVINYLKKNTAQNIWLRLGEGYADPPSETEHHFGWKIVDGDLYAYASNADGTTQEITDTTVDLASGMQRTRLKMVFNPGTDCKFYVNDVLKVTHTLNLPTREYYRLHFHLKMTGTIYRSIKLGRVLIEKEHA